jgi:hypothetical protein
MSPDVEHGSISGYKYHGCRCQMCRKAVVRYEKRRRWLVHQGMMPTVPAVGFKRRVHALMAIGWTQKAIANELGIATGNLAQKLGRNDTVRRATHVAMCEAYERLCMTPRSDVTALRTAAIAAKNGWPVPLAWDDIDNPDEKPADWRYRPADRHDLLHDLDEQGAGISVACRSLKLSREALAKWCERNGMSPTYSRLVARENGGETFRNQWSEVAS